MLKRIFEMLSLILTISLLLFNIFFAKKVNYYIPLVAIIVLIVITILLFGYRRVNRRNFMMNLLTIFGFTFLLQSVTYLIGTATGYTTNLGYITRGYVSLTNIALIFLVLFLREILRYILINIRTPKKREYYIIQTLNVLLCTTVDLFVAPERYLFTSFTLIYNFIALFLIPSLSKNIFLCYISNKSGYIATYLYVIIMDLNIYLLPSQANINTLLKSVVLLIFPYILYNYLKSLELKENVQVKEKKHSKVLSLITTIIFALMVALVSREFEYSMIGIGSGSMTGTINKGDAIIYRRYQENEEIKDKVIVFRKNDRLIVHRVINTSIEGGKYIYQTKGDHNKTKDNWTVDTKDIVGVVEFRVPLIAWPSVLLGEIF